MAERNPSDDQAAFGVFPQLKRNRSKQDREAAKNVPVDLARGALAGVMGAPGDIESIVRMLPYLDENTVLPTSEDIEKRLPFKSDTPVGRAATGLGVLGGGFYTGPGAPLRVVGALPSAIKRAGQDFAMASAAGVPHVIKPTGGNWLKGSRTTPGNVEQGIERLRPFQSQESTIEHAKSGVASRQAKGEDPAYFQGMLDEANKRNALNKWIEGNLQNYIKKQMGTPEDPVRVLHEQGVTHLPKDLLDETDYLPERDLRIRRGEAGFPEEGMGQSELAKKWENLADENIWSTKAGKLQAVPEQTKLAEDARAKLNTMAHDINFKFLYDVLNKPGSKLTVQERQKLAQMPVHKKAEILGNTEYDELAREYQDLKIKTTRTDEELAQANPWVGKVDPNADLYSGVPSGLGFDHIIDILKQDVEAGRIRPEQLNKISMEQAVRRAYEFDQEMAKRMREAQIKQQEGFPVHKEYPEGYKWIELAKSDKLPEGYTVDKHGNAIGPDGNYTQHPGEKMLEDALKYEGDTMGHCVGGYCPDVVEGRSRIYSLRDTKNEPHVTVEVEPNQHLDYNQWYGEQPTSYKALLNAKRSEPGYDPYQEPAYLAAREALPPRIVQIKGKQNAAPKEDYLPFVQDFVKSGKWSDIGDFRNTGLIKQDGQVMTPAEHADWLLKQLGTPPVEGMKRGGVVISNNPDTMMLAVSDAKMAGGGLAKLLRAAPKSKAEIEAIAERIAPQMLGEFVRGDKGTQSVAGKTQKQFAKEKEMVHDIRPTGAERPLPKPVDIEKLKGNVVIGIPGDPTISGQTLHSLNGIPLDSPSPQHGGPLYGLGRDDAFWASGLGAANRVQNLAREAGQQYGAPVLGKYIMMGPESINYAQHYADANLSAINPAKMTKEQIESFNNLVREGYPYVKNKERFQLVFPAFPGIENPSEAYLHFSIDPELRKHFNALMQTPTVTEKHALPSGIDVRHAITEPDLRDLETGVTGKSIGRMKPEITQLGLSEHPTYSHDIPGDFMGSSKYPMPYELSFPDTVRAIRENPKQAPHEFGSLKMVGPRQVIDQQMIDEIKQYEEQMKRLTGKKKGGAIKKQVGGVIKSLAKSEGLAKLAKLREEMAPRAEAVKNLIAKDETQYLRDVTPDVLTKEYIEQEVARMKARADASQPEVKKAKGGKVKMTDSRDTMFMELSNKKLKRK